jgi:hypothetical protein
MPLSFEHEMKQEWNPYDFAMHNVPRVYRRIDMSSFALVIIACVNSPIQLEGIWTPMLFLRQEWNPKYHCMQPFYHLYMQLFTFLFLKSIFSSALLSAIRSFDLFLTLLIVQGLYKKLYYIVTMKEASSVINTKESYTILD